jgi:uncharacterized membrane protein YsdA (DUF1294 family)
MTGTELLLYWLIIANFTGFVLMVWDKHRAQSGSWRTPESTLILWSLVGGSLGTFAAQRLIRHKTRKQPIATFLWLIPVLHLVVVAVWLSDITLPLPG